MGSNITAIGFGLLLLTVFVVVGMAWFIEKQKVTVLTPPPAPGWARTFVIHKILHVVAGWTFSFWPGYWMHKPWLGLILGVLAGIGKEVYDYKVASAPMPAMVRDVLITSSGALGAFLYLTYIVYPH